MIEGGDGFVGRPIVEGRTRAAQLRASARVKAAIVPAGAASGLPSAPEPLATYAGMDVDGPQVLESLAQLVEQTVAQVPRARSLEQLEGILVGMVQNACLFGWELAQGDAS